MLGDGRQVSAIATFIRLRVAEAPAMTLQESSFTPAPGEPFRPTVQGRRDGFLQRIEASLQPRQDVAHRRGWLRFRGEVIAGVPLSPLAQAALFADFGNGMAAGVDPQRFTFQNAELTLHLARLPRGSWVHLDCRTLDGGAGIGMTRTVFSDPDGDLGYAHQSLLIDPIA
jgi:hypothetical protein